MSFFLNIQFHQQLIATTKPISPAKHLATQTASSQLRLQNQTIRLQATRTSSFQATNTIHTSSHPQMAVGEIWLSWRNCCPCASGFPLDAALGLSPDGEQSPGSIDWLPLAFCQTRPLRAVAVPLTTGGSSCGPNGAQQAGSWAVRATFVAVVIGSLPTR